MSNRQSFLLQLTDVLRHLVKPEDIHQVVTWETRKFLNSDQCYYCEIENHRAIVRQDSAKTQFTSIVGSFLLSDMPILDKVVREGKTFVIRDVRSTDLVDNKLRASCIQLNVISFINIPVIKEHQVVGLLCIAQSHPRWWTASEINLATDIAERCWSAIEKIKADKALIIEKERMRCLKEAFQSILNGFALDRSLSILTDLVRRETQDRARVAFYLLNEREKQLSTLRGAGNMPDAYADKVDGFPATEKSFGCGLAVALGKPIKTADVREEPRWYPMLDLAEQFDFSAVWSFPMNWANKTLGSFTMHFENPKEPNPQELALADAVTQSASMIIAHHLEAQNRLRAEHEYRDLFNSLDEAFCILKAVLDDEGKPVDYLFLEANPEFYRQSGLQNFLGKTISELNAYDRNLWFKTYAHQAFIEASSANRSVHKAKEMNKWFDVHAFRTGPAHENKVAILFSDITQRVMSEENERIKTHFLLEQSEEIALLGSWEYQIGIGVMSWSSGMYRIFSLPEQSQPNPEIYLQYCKKTSRSAAYRIIEQIKSGSDNISEYLELNIEGKDKTIHVKAQTIFDPVDHNPVKVLGVDMDVSAKRAAEYKIKKMEKEQRQEILREILNAQEEERKRISESLHNGLGQLLYGIKLSLVGLGDSEHRSQVEKLIAEAIHESRRISHELMPTVLEDFGLKAAVEDVCHQLSDGTRFNCVYSGLDRSLPKYLELATFRTVQELMLNAVKHARATIVNVSLNIQSGHIEINVKDDGIGMSEDMIKKAGLGLASIKNKMELLHGTFNLRSSKDKGTSIQVIIPRYNEEKPEKLPNKNFTTH